MTMLMQKKIRLSHDHIGVVLAKAVERTDLVLARLCLEHGFPVDGIENFTPLQFCSVRGRTDIVRMLLDRGAAVDKTTPDEYAPLALAAQYGHADTVSMLLDRGAAVDQRGPFGKTALMLAARHGHIAAAQALLDRGASEKAVDQYGNNALRHAIESDDCAMMRLLLRQRPMTRPGRAELQFALSWFHLGTIPVLVDHGATLDLLEAAPDSLLIDIIECGRADLVAQLLDRGASVNGVAGRGAMAHHGAPLMHAVKLGHADVVRLLLDRGADTKVVSIHGEGPLELARRLGHQEIIELLSPAQRGVDKTI
jgi:ankyrin repeat protein